MSPLRFSIYILIFLIAGCATQHQEPRASAPSVSEEMLKDQSLILSQYAQRLSEVLESQSKLSHEVAGLQQDITGVNQLVASELKALRDSQAKAEQKAEDANKRRVEKKSLSQKQTILGRYEWVWLDVLSDSLKGRIDTGASFSSLGVAKIQPFERDGDSWVSFVVPELDEEKIFESPVLRYAKIRSGASDTGVVRRPVVKLTVRLGQLTEQAEFTLNEKEDSPYPVQLGRNFLRDIALVDVAKKFTQDRYEPPSINSVASP